MTPHIRVAAAATLAFLERDADGYRDIVSIVLDERELVGPLTALASSLARDVEAATGVSARDYLNEVLSDDDVDYLD